MTMKALYLPQSIFMRSLQSTCVALLRTDRRTPPGQISVFDNPRIYFDRVIFNAWVPA
jgi:hypothetical protein